MDLCVVDWKAITPICAALIASGIALYISNKWSKQKRFEVLASEARSLITDIFKLDQIIAEFKNIKISSVKEAHNKINELKVLNHVVNTKLHFLNDSIDRDSLELLIGRMNKFLNHLQVFLKCEEKDFISMSLTVYLTSQVENNIYNELSESIVDVLFKLRKVALYEKH